MPKRFYVAWALVVILALVLPIAIPYWVWPTYGAYEYEEIVELSREDRMAQSIRGATVDTRYIPSSVDVSSCDSGPGIRGTGLSAKLKLRGAFGLPLASRDYDCSGDYPINADGRAQPLFKLNAWAGVLALVLLIGGTLVVSYPLWRLQKRRRTNTDRSFWFRDEPVVLR